MFALVLVGGTILIDIIPMNLNYISLDSDGIDVRSFPQKYKILWRDVLFAQLTQQSKNYPFLTLETKHQSKLIGLKFFDATQIWALVQQNVSPDVLGQEARNKLSEIRQSEFERFPTEFDCPIQVSFSRWLKIFFWVSLVFYVYFSIWAYQSKQWDALFAFIPFILVSIGFGLYFNQFIQMDLNGILYKSILGSYAIRWDEIKESNNG